MKSIEAAGAFFSGWVSVGRGEAARKVRITIATPSFFERLGVKPLFGRLYGSKEDPPGGGSNVAVISYRLWNRDYRHGADVLGKPIRLGSQEFTIIGVAPKHFVGVDLDAVDAWVPFRTGKPEFMG